MVLKMLNYLKQYKFSLIYSIIYKMSKSILTQKVIPTTLEGEESYLFHNSNSMGVSCMDV